MTDHPAPKPSKKKKPAYKKRRIDGKILKPESLMMSYGYDPKWSEGSVKPPVFLTSTFIFESAEEGEEHFNVMAGRSKAPEGTTGGLIYSRFNHPNVEIVEDRLALIESSESACVCASGMGAISAMFFALLRPGDVVVYNAPLYGGTTTLISNLLSQFDIKSVAVGSQCSGEDFEKALDKAAGLGPVKMVYVETPTNPTNDIVDFEMLKQKIDDFTQKYGCDRPVTACDNTMLGPVFQTIIPQGIDLAVYSLTKYIGGHSDLVAGVVCGSEDMIKKIRSTRGAMGLNLDPHTSWMISRSMETLTIRMERSAETGRKVAKWLSDNPYVNVELLHPDFIDCPDYQTIYKRQCSGPGSTFAFRVKKDIPRATIFKFLNSLELFKLAVSLGGTESLICHPASTTHSGVPLEQREAAGVTEGLIRLSIGLEHPDDLILDLDQSFRKAFE